MEDESIALVNSRIASRLLFLWTAYPSGRRSKNADTEVWSSWVLHLRIVPSSKMSEENRNLSRRSAVLEMSRSRPEGSSGSLRCWLTYAEARSARASALSPWRCRSISE